MLGTALRVLLDVDDPTAWPDIKADKSRLIHGELSAMALRPGATSSGKPSVLLRIDFPDGKVCVVETTHALLEAAMSGFRGRMAYLAELERAGGVSS